MTDVPARTASPVVEMWFDATCPWTWMTSRWLVEVAERRGIDVRWHVMSLPVLNEGRDVEEKYRRSWPDSWAINRVLVVAERDHGAGVVGPLFTAIGRRRFLEDRTDTAAVIAEALAEVGLPASLAEAAATEDVDDLVRASHAQAMVLVGDDVGSPVIAIDGVGYFGPVVDPAPTGQEALDLFDGLVAMTRVPGFYELKRTRATGPQITPTD